MPTYPSASTIKRWLRAGGYAARPNVGCNHNDGLGFVRGWTTYLGGVTHHELNACQRCGAWAIEERSA